MNSFSSLAGALWYLRVNSLVGRIKSRLRRLKQPKYLAGAVVGVLYFYFVFFRRRPPHGGGGPGSPADALPADLLPLLGEIGALVLLLVLAINWFFPRRAALPFSEPEIAFLFPAPVSRRMLVHYRLLGAQFGIFFTAFIFTFVFGRGRAVGAHTWYQFFGWWIILALVNLHLTGTSFVYSRLLNPSITSMRRRVITLGAAAAVVLALLAWIAVSASLPTAADFGSQTDVARYVAGVLHAGPIPWLLALPKLVVAPYFATSVREFALALGPALVLIAVNYVWVVNTEVSFEEASIARAEKRAARRRAAQQGDWRGNVSVGKARTPVFELRSIGRPEIAFLWKNLLATGAFFRPRPIVLFTVILAGLISWISRHENFEPFRVMFTVVGTIILIMSVVLGPQIARQDLRTDLANADLLKTYPLRGWQVVLGEILTPVAVLSVVFWIALLTVYLSLPTDALGRISHGLGGEAAWALAVLAPPLLAIQVLMPNAATVFFPAWVQVTRDQAEKGIEVMGQRLIFMASQLLVTALAIVPAMLAGALFFVIANLAAGVAAGVAAAVIAMVTLLAFEAWLAIQWLGKRFESLDISAELRP